MSHPTSSPIIPFGLPTGGLDFYSPLSKMDPQFSPWMVNFIPESQYLKIRPGIQIHCTPSGTDEYVIGLGKYQNGTTEKLFAYAQNVSENKNEIFDITTTTPASSKQMATIGADEAYGVNYGGVLGFMTEFGSDDEAWYYNGSWNDWDLTYSGSLLNSRTTTYFKGRIYTFWSNYMYYSDTVGALTGTMNRVDMTELFSGDTTVQWAARLTSPGERSESSYFAFGNTDGEVLVYAGDNPDASNWERVGEFKTSPPIGNNTVLEYRNDVWILTMTGVVSLRDLFTKGSRAAQDLTVSWRIDPYWVKLVSGLNSYNAIPNVSAAFWPEQNKVFILVNNAVTTNGASINNTISILVYNCATEAWGLLRSGMALTTSAHSLTYFKNNLYFAADEAVMTFATDSLLDETFNSPTDLQTFTADMHSAYNRFGANNKYQRVHGFQPVSYIGDLTSLKMQAAADFGRKTTAQQSYTVVAAQEDQYHVPFLSVGIEGSYIQWRLEAVTHADSDARALELYSMGVSKGG